MKTKAIKNVEWNSSSLPDWGYSIREHIKWKQKYQLKEPKPNRKDRWNRGQMGIPYTHIQHDLSFTLLGTGSSIKRKEKLNKNQ